MEKRSLKAVLAKQEFFKGLSDLHLEILAGCAANTRFRASQYIFREGELAERFFLIRQGQVAVELPTAPRNVIVQSLGPDEVLGWSWLIPPYRWHLAARAVKTTLALSFDAKCIRAKFDRDPALGYEFHKRFSMITSRRLEETLLQLLAVCRQG
ncbi:MAG: cyclic nucleotide-binding domain-containing protein [Elusimicrobia bacterium]|nr:cyclic nucleotide-binding domain-containing protein [Elusimicrobiota bacterium]